MKINKNIRWISGAAAVCLLLGTIVWNFLPVASSQNLEKSNGGKQTKSSVPENYDIRYHQTKDKAIVAERLRGKLSAEKKDMIAKRAETMEEAKTKLGGKIANLRVKFNEEMGAPEIVDVERGRKFLTAASGRDNEKTVRDFIKSNKTLYGIDAQELEQFKTRAKYTNPDGNLSWVSLERKLNGLPVFGGEITAAFTKNGELVRTVGELTAGLDEAAMSRNAGISAQDAIVAAAQTIGVSIDPASLVLKEESPDGTGFVFERGPFAGDIKIELQYFPIETGVASLSWVMTL